MHDDHDNPYRNASLTTISRACMDIAAELQTPRQRSARERADLASRTAYLLIVVGHYLMPGDYRPCEPEFSLKVDGNRSLSATFLDWYHMLVSGCRLRVATRAANWVLGDQAANWLLNEAGHLRRDGPRATESDQGLEHLLALLEEMQSSQRSTPENPS